jgi:hypothetical protein
VSQSLLHVGSNVGDTVCETRYSGVATTVGIEFLVRCCSCNGDAAWRWLPLPELADGSKRERLCCCGKSDRLIDICVSG